MKEFCIDFSCLDPVYIKGKAVERIDTYMYVGVGFDSKLNWKENINSVLKKEKEKKKRKKKKKKKKKNRECIA